MLVDLLVDAVPDRLNAVLVVEALEDAVAADHEKVEILLQLENTDLWIANNNVWIASIAHALCFDVAKSPRDRKQARKSVA